MAKVLGMLSCFWVIACTVIFGVWGLWVYWGAGGMPPGAALAAAQGWVAVSLMPAAMAALFIGPLLILGRCLLADRSARLSASFALVLVLVGVVAPTLIWITPMDRGLLDLPTFADTREASRLWVAYSDPWVQLNGVRTVCAALATGCLFWGLCRS